MRVGDKVSHKDYPEIVGWIITRRPSQCGKRPAIYEVAWEGTGILGASKSKHIESALRMVRAAGGRV